MKKKIHETNSQPATWTMNVYNNISNNNSHTLDASI